MSLRRFVRPVRRLLRAFGGLQHPLCVIQRTLQLGDVVLNLLDRTTTHTGGPFDASRCVATLLTRPGSLVRVTLPAAMIDGSTRARFALEPTRVLARIRVVPPFHDPGVPIELERTDAVHRESLRRDCHLFEPLGERDAILRNHGDDLNLEVATNLRLAHQLSLDRKLAYEGLLPREGRVRGVACKALHCNVE